MLKKPSRQFVRALLRAMFPNTLNIILFIFIALPIYLYRPADLDWPHLLYHGNVAFLSQ